MLSVNEVEAVRNAVVWRLNQGDAPLEGGDREALIRSRERFHALTGDDLRLVRVDTAPRIFDFAGGGITAEGAPDVPPMEVDLARLEVRPI